MIKMTAFILTGLLGLSGAPVLSADLNGLIQSTPNIVFGKVYLSNPNYLMVEVSWELKGCLNTEIIEVPIDRSQDNGLNYGLGEKLLVFVCRNAVRPMRDMPLSDLRLSPFDEFNGQYAFMKITIDSDYRRVSDVYASIHGKDPVSGFP